MIGLVLAGYGDWAEALLRGWQGVDGVQDAAIALALDRHGAVEPQRAALAAAIRQADQGAGVLVLTDGPGETATNLARSLMQPDQMLCLAGCNLPMLREIARARKGDIALIKLAELARDGARNGVALHLPMAPPA